MRYYSIVITDPKTNEVYTPPGFKGLLGGASYTSFVNNQTLPGAWNVEFDMLISNQTQPSGSYMLTIYGVSLQEIAQANNLKNKNIKIYGGMQAGLPLANPAQAGLLVSGFIFQAFGNWLGTEMTLNLEVMPGTNPNSIGTPANPRNLVHHQPAGQPMATTLKNTLNTAFPGFPVNINISPKLVRPNDEVGAYYTLEQLASYIYRTSHNIMNDTSYTGVQILLDANNAFQISDGTTAQSKSKQIQFQDLIGQPTWINAPNIWFKTVMRADLKPQDSITLPKTLITNTQQANTSQVNQTATFQGGFRILSARHIGHFRQPTADAWVSVFECSPLTPVLH